jgi:hypothetical protein
VSEKAQQLRYRAYFNDVRMADEFSPPVYRVQKHQLPKIVPKQQHVSGGGQVNRGYRQPVIQRGQVPFGDSPQVQNQFTPQKKSSMPIPVNKPTPQGNGNKNNNANFGYSTTDPLLTSETEESKVDSQPKRPHTKKPRPMVINQQDSTHIFDPSKATNLPPPPPKTRHPHDNMSQNQDFKSAPTYPEPSVRTTQATFEPPPFANQYREPEPVIAATNVMPPTAQMKPKVARPAQRYAPPPRLHGVEPVQQNAGAMPPHSNQPPMPRPVTGPPARGRGAPPMRGRGGPPMPARGGGAPVSRSPAGQAPAPVPFGGPPGGVQQNAQLPGAPPPPKIGRRR